MLLEVCGDDSDPDDEVKEDMVGGGGGSSVFSGLKLFVHLYSSSSLISSNKRSSSKFGSTFTSKSPIKYGWMSIKITAYNGKLCRKKKKPYHIYRMI